MISAAAFAVNMPSAMHVGPILSCWNPMWPSFFLLLKTSICPCGPWPAFSAVVQKRLPRDNQSGCWKNPSLCCVSAQTGAIRAVHPLLSVAKNFAALHFVSFDSDSNSSVSLCLLLLSRVCETGLSQHGTTEHLPRHTEGTQCEGGFPFAPSRGYSLCCPSVPWSFWSPRRPVSASLRLSLSHSAFSIHHFALSENEQRFHPSPQCRGGFSGVQYLEHVIQEPHASCGEGRRETVVDLILSERIIRLCRQASPP